MAEAYDFSPFGTMVDIGGATGTCCRRFCQRHQGPRGILFDLPHVVAEAPAFLRPRVGRARRVEAGSFFEGVPAGGDAYVLSHIIHDWDEEQCQTILGHCRRAMPASGRLLLVEMVLPEGDTPHPGKLLDMLMLTVPGGEERTQAQYGALLDRAGFQMTRVVPTASLVSIVEAVPH